MKKFYYLLLLILVPVVANAQLSLNGQLRTRTELRDGQGAPLPNGSKPAFFTSQRTRLQVGYKLTRTRFNATVQDVRVWGQDGSTLNRSTLQDLNGVMLHEAWAEIDLVDTTHKKQVLSLKIGRQELVYDDQRLLGNLDWLQQGRRHDAAVLKFSQDRIQVHVGAAFNQNRELSTGTPYQPVVNGAGNTNGGLHYKSMQFVHATRKLRDGSISLLVFADQFSRYQTIEETRIWLDDTWKRYTTGLFYTKKVNSIALSAAAYYQGGQNANGQRVKATHTSLAANYPVTKKINLGIGHD